MDEDLQARLDALNIVADVEEWDETTTNMKIKETTLAYELECFDQLRNVLASRKSDVLVWESARKQLIDKYTNDNSPLWKCSPPPWHPNCASRKARVNA